MMYRGLQRYLPRRLRRWILHFEAVIEDSVRSFAARLPAGARLLDAGAGEGSFREYFAASRYTGVDLGIGDAAWNYSGLDALADLHALPFESAVFDGAVNIVTLEHVREPAQVLRELARVMKPGGALLLVVPHEWEEHQQPHDYFRYTRFGVAYLLEQAGFDPVSVTPVGGYFRLLSRRLLNGLQFFPGPWMLLAAVFLAPPALLAPLLEPLDKTRNFTLGFVCEAKRKA